MTKTIIIHQTGKGLFLSEKSAAEALGLNRSLRSTVSEQLCEQLARKLIPANHPINLNATPVVFLLFPSLLLSWLLFDMKPGPAEDLSQLKSSQTFSRAAAEEVALITHAEDLINQQTNFHTHLTSCLDALTRRWCWGMTFCSASSLHRSSSSYITISPTDSKCIVMCSSCSVRPLSIHPLRLWLDKHNAAFYEVTSQHTMASLPIIHQQCHQQRLRVASRRRFT